MVSPNGGKSGSGRDSGDFVGNAQRDAGLLRRGERRERGGIEDAIGRNDDLARADDVADRREKNAAQSGGGRLVSRLLLGVQQTSAAAARKFRHGASQAFENRAGGQLKPPHAVRGNGPDITALLAEGEFQQDSIGRKQGRDLRSGKERRDEGFAALDFTVERGVLQLKIGHFGGQSAAAGFGVVGRRQQGELLRFPAERAVEATLARGEFGCGEQGMGAHSAHLVGP